MILESPWRTKSAGEFTRMTATTRLGIVECLAPARYRMPLTPKASPRHTVISLLAILALWMLPEPPRYDEQDRLETILARELLSVHTRNTPTTYYEGREGPTGFEYELVRRFAGRLGTSLTIHTDHHIDSALEAVRREGDMAAAALPLDPGLPGVVFSRPIIELQPVVVYRRGLAPVEAPDDLSGLTIGSIGGAGIGGGLSERQIDYRWTDFPRMEVAELLGRIEDGELDAAVIFEHQFRLNRLFFPDVESGFPLGKPLTMAWAFPADRSLALVEAANHFLTELHEAGEFDALVARYFGHDDYLEYVGTRTFLAHVDERLPDYDELFREAARKTDFDWKLLAAMGYQESHWDPLATSPTGVRGMMMLTNATAGDLGVDNRLDPDQSIQGGARYLRQLHERLPESIQGDNRLYMAMAAYNVGLGHLYDARLITERRGGNPDLWADVRESLPLLQKREWHTQTKYGYARGGEPVLYVRNIRRYHEILSHVERSRREFPRLDARAREM